LSLYKKLDKLKKLILKYNPCLIAFSGGVDSSFLFKIAAATLPKEKLLAVTAISPTYPKEELVNAKKIAKLIGARHKIIRTYEGKNKNFSANPANRCYFCKKELFSRLKDIAKSEDFKTILDASNASDKLDFRPGSIAKKELKVRSPLQEAGFTKDDIRKLSRKFKLPNWNKPSLACLASRIPYGDNISSEVLKRINEGEIFLRSLGFKQVRVRDYGRQCRIEVNKDKIRALISKGNLVVDKLKKLGYNYVTVDLEGYRTGSMNPALSKKELSNLMRKGWMNGFILSEWKN
jgi:uncharacterized protein